MARVGRRPGDSGTRDAILAASRTRFAEAGYRGASIRSIAAEAGVDPALVHHYFGSKRDLFAAALDVPVRPEAAIADMIAGDPSEIGERVVSTFLEIWDEPAARDRLRMLIRGAVTDEQTARMAREFLVGAVFARIAASTGADRPQLRAALAASQIMGLALTRYVIDVDPLTSASNDLIVAAYAPTIQRYLTGDIDASEA